MLKALRPDEGVLAPSGKRTTPTLGALCFCGSLLHVEAINRVSVSLYKFVSEKKHITPSLLVVIEYEKGLYDRSLVYHSGSWNHCLVRSKLCSDVGTVQGTVYGSMRNHCFVSVA